LDEDLDAGGGSGVGALVLPVAVLVVVVAVICALVLSGVVQGDEPRRGAGVAPTTVPTVEIGP
jgi:hypothetical protein